MELINRLITLSEPDRISVLESECASVEEGTYTRSLTDSELLSYKETLAEKSVEQAQILEEFKNVKDTYKQKLKPISKEISNSLQAIKFKAIESIGRQYKLADHDEQMIYIVDTQGDVIHSRRMRPEERQYFLKPSKSA
jgi:predicted RNA-binding protein with EMAP domain